MLKSRNDYQEKKTRFYANILVNSAFDETVSPAAIDHVLAMADRLTYRQLCLLQLFSNPQPIQLRGSNYRKVEIDQIPEDTRSVLREAYALYQEGLVINRPEEDKLVRMGFDVASIRPIRMMRTAFGDRVHRMMGLEGIFTVELTEVAGLLL